MQRQLAALVAICDDRGPARGIIGETPSSPRITTASSAVAAIVGLPGHRIRFPQG